MHDSLGWIFVTFLLAASAGATARAQEYPPLPTLRQLVCRSDEVHLARFEGCEEARIGRFSVVNSLNRRPGELVRAARSSGRCGLWDIPRRGSRFLIFLADFSRRGHFKETMGWPVGDDGTVQWEQVRDVPWPQPVNIENVFEAVEEVERTCARRIDRSGTWLVYVPALLMGVVLAFLVVAGSTLVRRARMQRNRGSGGEPRG